MTPVLLSRIQFALTIGFHYIFPPLSIGLSLVIVILEGMYLRTKDKFYLDATRFWVGLFALTFTVGAATGIVMEFEFGTNWSAYSRFVGDVFGSPLAAEGMMAFFLESTFLGVLLFGWNRVSPRLHFLSACLVCLGAHLSAFWIVVANSWMQTPAGYELVEIDHKLHAHITDFWAMVFNPSAIPRLSHVYLGCWLTGAFFVMGVSALYLLLKRHERFARTSLQVGLLIAAASSLGQLFTGHASAIRVAATQPAKLAAFEAHFDDQTPGDLYLMGWVDANNERAWGLKIPGLLSWLVTFDASTPLPGLKAFPSEERPPVQFVFQTYHFMVAIGMALIGLSFLGLFLWWRDALFSYKPYLTALVPALLLPQFANQLGWMSAEVGRQPWIVYRLLRTTDAVSKTLGLHEVVFSLLLFGTLYLLLFAAFLYLTVKAVQKGPALTNGRS